jgi:hypothetical protein
VEVGELWMDYTVTHLVVVVFGGVNDRDITGFQTLSRGIEPVVQLLGDAQSSGSYPRVGGFSWQYNHGRREEAEKGLCEIMDSKRRTSPQDYDFEFVLGRSSGACPSHAIDDCVSPQDSRGSPYR